MPGRRARTAPYREEDVTRPDAQSTTRAANVEPPATIAGLLSHAAGLLERAGIPSPRDEARVLLQHATGLSTASVLAHPETAIPPDQQRAFLAAVRRRTRFEPMAYITGIKEFFGLPFEVNPTVLVPRPETELLVERALDAARRLAQTRGRPLTVVDLGTGSGAIAIAIAVNDPSLRLIAVDSSVAALETARRNAARHAVSERIDFRHSDLLDGVDEEIDLLVANLPYIPSAATGSLMPDVRFYEPVSALDGGLNGTVPTRRAMEQAAARIARPSSLLFEIGDGQGAALGEAAERLYPGARVAVRRDYAGFERILSIEIGVE
jgi:release factor glutamine methyltransferase